MEEQKRKLLFDTNANHKYPSIRMYDENNCVKGLSNLEEDMYEIKKIQLKVLNKSVIESIGSKIDEHN